jgi:hypothetical protein
MIRMLIVGYCFGIRSERRLCEEVHLNLAYRWFCHLGLDDAVPEHSTFSKNRPGRFRDSDTSIGVSVDAYQGAKQSPWLSQKRFSPARGAMCGLNNDYEGGRSVSDPTRRS